METEENKVVVRRLLEAIWDGDLAALDAHPGLQDMRRMLPIVRTAFPDFGGTIERQIAEGDTVATHALCHGTHRGPFMGIAPTGKRVSFQSVSLDRVVGGTVVQRNSELGWLGVLLQLGVLPLNEKSERGEDRSMP
ncbi:MAG: ester cyclase [Thermomicrobia bacterium]|nr:ester cyclase [Thermomicrobia bacterium]